MDALWQDLRFALRQLLRNPGLTLAAALSLGLGIGANTSIFSLINAVFLNPLPGTEADEVVVLYRTFEQEGTAGGGFGGVMPISYPNFVDFREQSQLFDSLAAEGFGRFNLSSGEEAEEVFGAYVTASYFDVLGLRPAAGRFFRPDEDDTRGTHPVEVLGHSLWRNRFGADPGIVGDTIRLNGRDFTVVGVASRGFRGASALGGAQLFVPTAMAETLANDPGLMGQLLDHRGVRMFNAMGRLGEGTTIEQAQAEMDGIAKGLAEAHPMWNRNRGARLMPLVEAAVNPGLRSAVEAASAMLMGAVALVLAIACANVANLLIARSMRRRGEIATRLALGAPRRRIARQLLTEAVLIWCLGGLVGWAVAFWGRELLWSFRPPFLAADAVDLSLDWRVLGFTLVVTLATGVLFGLAPALRAARTDLITSLRLRAGDGSDERGGLGLRQLLVSGQVALCLVALIGATLFLKSLWNAQQIDPGYDASRLLLMNFDTGARGFEVERAREFHDRVLEQASSIPGVEAVALASHPPLTFAGSLRLQIPGAEELTGPEGVYITTNSISPGYFDLMGIDIAAGRPFEAMDREGGRRVAMVNQTMAEKYWGGASAVGRAFRITGDDEAFEVVGVARDIKYATLGEDPSPYVYFPLAQFFDTNVSLHVRTAAAPAALLQTVIREIQDLDGELAITNPRVMEDAVRQSLWGATTAASFLGAFAIVALLLAATGIYAVVSQMVQQRRRELGIRIALGASRSEVMGLVLRRGMLQVALGVVAGIALAASTTHLLQSLLYGLTGTEPVAFLAAALLLSAIAFVACLIPGRSATRVDPMTTLRES